MADRHTRVRMLLRRLSRPFPAALLFCGMGLFSAVVVIGINRAVASRPALPVPVAIGAAGSPSTSPSPSPTATVSVSGCTDSQPAAAALDGLTVASDTQVLIVVGSDTVSVTIPAGATLSGSPSDVTIRTPGVPPKAPRMHGTVAQDVALCTSGGAGGGTVTIPAGTSADAEVAAGPAGITAVSLHLTTPPAPPPSAPAPGGDQGGDG